MTESPGRRRLLTDAVPLALLLAGGCQSSTRVGPEAIAGKSPDGFVRMDEVQAAYIGSAGGGSGVLDYRGRSYPFNVGGAGIGSIGASKIEAEARSTICATFPNLQEPMRRGAMASPSAPRAQAISGSRTRPG